MLGGGGGGGGGGVSCNCCCCFVLFNKNVRNLPWSQHNVRKSFKTFGRRHIKVEDQGGVIQK
jgi:uncharacterized spore protein YtfJ